MPPDLAPLWKMLFELRGLVFPSPGEADFCDVRCPGLLSGYVAAVIANPCWRSGELPLWTRTEDGDFEQIAWHSGRSLDWPDTAADVAITEYQVGLIPMLEGKEPLLLRREFICTTAAGTERLRAFAQAEVRKIPKGTPAAAVQQAVRELLLLWGAPQSEEGVWKRFKKDPNVPDAWRPRRADVRAALNNLKSEDEAFKPTIGRPPGK